MTAIAVAFLWWIWLGVSSVSSGSSQTAAEAFRSAIQRRFQPVLSTPMVPPFLSKADPVKSLSELGPSLDMTNFLNDLTPPFAVEVDMADITAHVQSPDVTHFCFLLHGHRGFSRDLFYLQTVMQRLAAVEKKRRSSDAWDSDATATTSDSDDSLGSKTATHDVVVHNSVCNEHKTNDGVENGGDRLVAEMREVIETEMIKRHPEIELDSTSELYNVTISVLGNSLGGLFGRYAIAHLIERHCVKESDEPDACYILDGKYRLHLNVFCTTATPHLGVSRHTYLKIPRSAEIGVAHAMGNTGKDLFRLNDLLHTMATSPTYLEPLANFRKRVAYANAYGTDFPVPASTAAFLSENSTYPHHFEKTEYKVDVEDKHSGYIIATLKTPQQPHNEPDEALRASCNKENNTGDFKSTEDEEDELHDMSRSLDKLGWKKVFVDIRRELPTAELPRTLWMRRQHSDSEVVLNTSDGTLGLDDLQRHKSVLHSREVASAVATPADNRVALPFAHNMIVAFSRSRVSTFMNKGGRPIVDNLAKELVQDIFTWDEGTTAGNASEPQRQ